MHLAASAIGAYAQAYTVGTSAVKVLQERIEMKRCTTALAHLLARTRRPEAAHAAHCKTLALEANSAGFTGTLVRCSRRNISARKVTSVPEWDRQFRLVRVHYEHREELGRLRLAGIGADAVASGLDKES